MSLVGIFLMLFSWFNPFGLDLMLQIIIFVIGFDMTHVYVKILTFWINFLFPIGGGAFDYFSYFLLGMLGLDVLVAILSLVEWYGLILKPLFIFTLGFYTIGFQPALIISGLDLALNLKPQIKSDKRQKTKKTKKGKTKTNNRK